MRSGHVFEFDSPEALLEAYNRLRKRGCTHLSSWTPYPVRGVLNHLPKSPVATAMLIAAFVGCAFAYALQWWCNAYNYPINVGGRPLHAIPAFIPIAFETTVLAAGVTGFFAALGLSGLPRLRHPLSNVPGVERVTVDRFWLGVDDVDPAFNSDCARDLEDAGALCRHYVGRDE